MKVSGITVRQGMEPDMLLKTKKEQKERKMVESLM